MRYTIDQLVEFFKSSSEPLINEIKLIRERLDSLPPEQDLTPLREQLAELEKCITAAEHDTVKQIRQLTERVESLPVFDAAALDAAKKQMQQIAQASGERLELVSQELGEITKRHVPDLVRRLDEIDGELSKHLAGFRSELSHAPEQAREIAAELIADQLKLSQQPVEKYTPGATYPPGRKVTHLGGVWESVAETRGEPSTTAGWLLICDGIKSVNSDNDSLTLVTTSGDHLTLSDLKGERGQGITFKGPYQDGFSYQLNNIAVTDGAAWLSLCDDNNTTPPGEKWACLAQRGPRGQRGYTGKKPGADELIPLIDDVFKANYLRLAAAAAQEARTPPTTAEVMPIAKEAIEDMLPAYHKALRTDLDQRIEKQFDTLSAPGVSFRGVFNLGDDYKRGETVRFRSGLYVALDNNSGILPTDSDYWRLMLAQPKTNQANARVTMYWEGNWTSQQYAKHSVVRDGQWLMIANKITSERAAPVAVADPIWGLPDNPAFATGSEIAVVYTGHRYEFTQGGWVKSLRVWVPELSDTTNYRIRLVDATDPNNPVVVENVDPLLVENGWAVVSLNTALVAPGVIWFVYVDALNSAADSPFSGGWTYQGTENTLGPAVGGWNKRTQEDLVRFSKTDLDGTSRTAELLGAVPDTNLLIVDTSNPNAFWEYVVSGAAIDAGDHIQFPVTLLNTGLLGVPVGTSTATFTVPVAQATQYSEQLNYWDVNPLTFADVSGFKQYNGVDQPGNENSAYGIDIQFTEGAASDDWDVLTTSQDSAAGVSPPQKVLLLNALSNSTQQPVAVDTPLQLTLGAAQGTVSDPVMIDAAGNITFNQSGNYEIEVGLQFGRTGAVGSALIFGAAFVDGAQIGNSVFAELDDSEDKIPGRFSGVLPFGAGQVLTLQIYRDSAGIDAGGVFTATSGIGWNAAPSAFVVIYRYE